MMSETRKYIRPARWYFSVYFVLFFLGILFLVFILFGYYFIVNLSKNEKELKREELVISEIHWYGEIKKSLYEHHSTDTANTYFQQALKNLTDSFEYADSTFKSILSDLSQQSASLNTTFDSSTYRSFEVFQKKLLKIIIEQRFIEKTNSTTKWNSNTAEILKKITIFIGAFLFFCIALTPFLGPLLFSFWGKRTFSKWLLYGITVSLLLFFLFLVMKSSGRISEENSYINNLPFIIISIIVALLTLNHFLNKNINIKRKIGNKLTILIYVLFIICLYIMIAGVAQGAKTNIYGKFKINEITHMVEVEQRNLLIFSLELSIAIMFLILVLIYSVFPAFVYSSIFIQPEPKYSRLGWFRSSLNSLHNKIMRFRSYHCWGWNHHYNYYMNEILTESSIQIILGFLGSIIMLLIPFLFSSATYFSSSFLFSSNLYHYPKILISEPEMLGFIVTPIILFFLLKLINSSLHGSEPRIWFKIFQIVFELRPLLCLIFPSYIFIKFFNNPSDVILIIYLILISIFWLWILLSWEYDSGRRHGFFFSIFLIPLFYLILNNLNIFPQILKQEISQDILSRIFGIQFAPLSHTELFISLSSIIPLFLLWISPILIGFEALDSKFSAQTLRILRWVIQHLREHTVVFGYGDLGKKVGEGIVRRIVIPSSKNKKGKVIEQFNFAEILSTRRQRFVDLCIDFIVVDKNSGVFDETHPDPDYGTFGICDIENGEGLQASKEKPIVLLGLVGDCKDPAIHDDVNLEFSKIIIFTGRDEEAIFPLFNEIYKLHQDSRGSSTSAIICVQKRFYGAYLEWRCVNNDIYFVYPPFLRGTIVGEMISNDMIKQKFKPDEMKENERKVLIVGEGNQLFYILLTLQEDLQKFFFELDPEPINKETGLIGKGEATKFIENNVKLISDEEHIEQKSVETLPKMIINSELKPAERKWLIHPLIGMLSDDAFTWNIKVYFDSPDNILVLRSVLQLLKPDIVVIASTTSTKTNTITMELLLTLERMRRNNTDYKPHIIVGSRMVEWKQIRDAVACWRAEIRDQNFYPIQEVDSVVDFYDDATNMIVNLRDALSQQSSEREDEFVGEPIEISRCATRVPYGLAEFLSVISNLKFSRGKSKILNRNIDVPIFHNYRSINMKHADLSELTGDRENKHSKIFCFTSGITSASLHSNKINNRTDEVKKRRQIMIVSTKEKNLAKLNEQNLLTPLFQNKKDCLPSEKIVCPVYNPCIVNPGSCSKRRLCPIDISVHHMEALETQQEWQKRMKSSFQKHCMCNCIPEQDNPFKDIKSKTYAQLSICGYGGDEYGAISRAINLLVFRDGFVRNKPHSDYVIDLQYERSFGCYNPYRNYFKFYGIMKRWDNDRLEVIERKSFINAVLIRPATIDGFDLWLDYAKLLFKLIRSYESWRNKYSLFTSAPDIILLFRRNERLFNNIQEKLIDFHNHNPQYTSHANYNDPDRFLYALRGYKHQGDIIWPGICNERNTSCPFEKIQDESRTYHRMWREEPLPDPF